MPYREPDPSDPTMLVGAVVDCSERALHEMAVTFADELIRLGHRPSRVLELFRRPFYAGPHLAWSALGEDRVRRIIDESAQFWGNCTVTVKDADRTSGGASAGVLPIDERRGGNRGRS